jgi:hypothetical protein
MKPRQVNLLSYRKTGAEDVKLHHRNLHNAIRKGEALNCDSTARLLRSRCSLHGRSVPARKSVSEMGFLWTEG